MQAPLSSHPVAAHAESATGHESLQQRPPRQAVEEHSPPSAQADPPSKPGSVVPPVAPPLLEVVVVPPFPPEEQAEVAQLAIAMRVILRPLLMVETLSSRVVSYYHPCRTRSTYSVGVSTIRPMLL
jgi:hypothetical protein